jgi:hypothetical protein
LFPLPPPISKGNDSKDNRLVDYKEELVMTCINRENDFMKVWIMKDYNGKQCVARARRRGDRPPAKNVM